MLLLLRILMQHTRTYSITRTLTVVVTHVTIITSIHLAMIRITIIIQLQLEVSWLCNSLQTFVLRVKLVGPAPCGDAPEKLAVPTSMWYDVEGAASRCNCN